MRKFNRLPEPEFLRGVWESWGAKWETRKANDPKESFSWRQVDGEPVNHKLLPHLKAQTQDHCSFCDNYPVSPPSLDTIEHFRPKSKYPREAYRWTNLYYCCMACQLKNDDFDEAALRPDADDYEFDRYFRWDFTRGTLEVNDKATPDNQRRAEVTRALYRLNIGHPQFRLRAQFMRSRAKDRPLDQFAYRDFIE